MHTGDSRAPDLARPGAFSVVMQIGLIAGTLDLTENLIFNQFRGITSKMVFQYIASGLIGTKSFQSGVASVVLGVVLHYLIALAWTGVFYGGKPQARYSRPSAGHLRSNLRRLCVPVHELDRPAPVWGSPCKERLHDRLPDQRRAGRLVVHRIDYFPAGAAQFRVD